MRRLAALVLVVASCSSGGGTAAAPVVEQFTGDRGSRFCDLSRTADLEPFENPFEAGLSPLEVRTRFRRLEARFRALADAAPPELTADLDRLVRAFDDFAGALDDAGFDFDVLARAGVDVTLFDDPAFLEIGQRIDAYQSQVCGAG